MKTQFKPYFTLIASFLGLAMVIGVTSILTFPGLTNAAVDTGKIQLSVSGPSNVTTNSTVTYTGTLLNNFAGGPLSHPVVTATIPAGMTFVSGTSNAESNHTCTQSGAYVVCDSGPYLHQSHSATITLTFKVTAACGLNTRIQMGVTGKLGPHEAWQQVGFPWTVNNVSNVIAIKTPACPVVTPNPTPKPTPTPVVVAPKLFCTPTTQVAGISQPITMTATNGQNNVTGIWSAPQGMPATGNTAQFTTKYVTAGVKTVTVAANGLIAQCQVTVRPVITVPPTVPPVITPTPTVTPTVTPTPGPETTPGPTSNPHKGIEVSKTDNRDVMHPGTVDTYVITVKNTSETDLKDVKVRDRVPSYLTVTAASNNGHRDGNEVTWENLSFNPGEIQKFTITAKVKDSVANNTVVLNEVTAASQEQGVSAKGSDTTKVTRNPQVAGIISVPVTAKTGAGSMAIVTTLLGGSGLLTIFRKKA